MNGSKDLSKYFYFYSDYNNLIFEFQLWKYCNILKYILKHSTLSQRVIFILVPMVSVICHVYRMFIPLEILEIKQKKLHAKVLFEN